MSFICSKCGRECKDKRGLSRHENKCGEEKNIQCEHCNDTFTTSRNLLRHYIVCKVLKDKQKKQDETNRLIQEEQTRKDLEELRTKYLSIELLYRTKCIESESYCKQLQDQQKLFERQAIDYEQKLSNERLLKDNMINMCKEDQSKLHADSISLKSKIKDLELQFHEQKEATKRITRERDFINNKMIQFAEKASDKGTTIYQTNSNSNVQNTHVQLQHFDGSFFRNKIIPPSRMVYSVSTLVDHAHRFGLGNFYRSLDRSRNVVVWIDQDGKEIRDSNCSQLREKLLSTMEGDIRLQLEYQQNRLAELESIHGETFTDEMGPIADNIGFCKQLLSRKAALMKQLQKELSTRARNKNDTTIDVPRIVGHTKFTAKLEEKMISNLNAWMGLSFEGFGRWIASQLTNEIEIEEAILYKEKKFIKIKNDEGTQEVIYTSEFCSMVRRIYNDSVSSKAQSMYHPLLKTHPLFEHSNVDEMFKWIQEPKEKQSDEVIRGILLQKMNR